MDSVTLTLPLPGGIVGTGGKRVRRRVGGGGGGSGGVAEEKTKEMKRMNWTGALWS